MILPFKTLFIYSYIYSLIPTCHSYCTGRLLWGIDYKLLWWSHCRETGRQGGCWEGSAAPEAVIYLVINHWKKFNKKWFDWHVRWWAWPFDRSFSHREAMWSSQCYSFLFTFHLAFTSVQHTTGNARCVHHSSAFHLILSGWVFPNGFIQTKTKKNCFIFAVKRSYSHSGRIS